MRVNLQRAAKVYLLVSPEWDSSLPVATLTGWKSEGYAERVVGEDIVYGVHQKLERWAPSRVYVFSRRVRGSFFLPNERWIEQNTKGIKTGGNWLALIAEADGSASAVPRNPTGVDDAILPNKKCPDSLHDLWVTRNTDKDDADTKGKMWRTCHPMWDPCYWW